jgi:hypothetical protein
MTARGLNPIHLISIGCQARFRGGGILCHQKCPPPSLQGGDAQRLFLKGVACFITCCVTQPGGVRLFDLKGLVKICSDDWTEPAPVPPRLGLLPISLAA